MTEDTNNNNSLYMDSIISKQGINYMQKQQNRINKGMQQNELLWKSDRINGHTISGQEGFQNYESTTNTKTPITNKAAQKYDDNRILEKEIANLNDLKIQYNKSVDKYNSYLANSANSATNYIARTSKKDAYKNKNITFNGNALPKKPAIDQTMYVTNQGVAKWYPDVATISSTMNKNNCPANTATTKINTIQTNYNKLGSYLTTTPHLKVGTPMKPGQSCGNEGENIFVNSVLSPNIPKPTYMGCYADDPNSRVMSFIGATPPSSNNLIVNGDFTQPILQNNSYQFINDSTTVPGWIFTNTYLINNWLQFNLPKYPSGPQFFCFSGYGDSPHINSNIVGKISQNITITTAGTYQLSFYAISYYPNEKFTGSIWIQNGESNIYGCIPQQNKWNLYSTIFTVNIGTTIINIVGDIELNKGTICIQGVTLTKQASGPPEFNYESCQSAAISSGNRYFALQDADVQTGMGYCAVSNDSIGSTKNGISTVTNNFVLWQSNTSKKNVSNALLNNEGSLIVLASDGITKLWSSPPLSTCVQVYSNTANSDSGGNDIYNYSSAPNTTVSGCEIGCNETNSCAGFVFDNTNNFCYLKMVLWIHYNKIII